MNPKSTVCWLVVISFISVVFTQNVSINAWVSEGYYYSHRCEITLEIISDYFQKSYQLFHILSKQNAFFFNTIEYDNTFYIKGNNSMEAVMTSNEIYCKFPMSTTYYCPFISLTGYDPYGINYFQKVNATHRRLTLRLTRSICPAEGTKMSFRVQMPISSDYSQFYMYSPSITTKSVITVDKLSFVYDKEVFVNTQNLSYKQVKEISVYPEQKNYLIGCKVDFRIVVKFENMSYYDSWDQINIYILNQQIVQLSAQCTSNLTKSNNCSKTSYGYQLRNLDQVNINKSYEIAEQQYYSNYPAYAQLQWEMHFVKTGILNIEVVCKANNNTIQESWLNMTHSTSQIYGRKIVSIEGFDENLFNKLSADKFNPLKCVNPFDINKKNTTDHSKELSNSTSTNNTANDQTSNHTNDNYNENYTYYDTTTGFQISQLLFITVLITFISLTIFFTQTISRCLKILYLLTIIFLSISKILFFVLGINQQNLKSVSAQGSDSIMIRNEIRFYSLQIFILKYTFSVQLILNFFYIVSYIIVLICSEQIVERINKFYGSKYLSKVIDTTKQKVKLYRCNIYSSIFTIVTFLIFLISFKIFGALLFKLSLNLNAIDSEFKKYCFKNSAIYKIHLGQLIIELFLEFNAVVWMFLLLKSCQNQILTYYLYSFIGIYCLEILMLAKTVKVFYLMSRKSDEINSKTKKYLKSKCQLIDKQSKISDQEQNLSKEIQVDSLKKYHHENDPSKAKKKKKNYWKRNHLVQPC